MSDELSQKIFDKIDAINAGLAVLNTHVALMSFKLDTHLAEAVTVKATAANEQSGIKVNIASWVIIGLVSTIGVIALYAVKNGWRP